MCKQCGWAHVCGPNCTERIMDTVTGLPVCPISGTCFDQMMTAWEVNVCSPLCLECVLRGLAWPSCRHQDACCGALHGLVAGLGMCAALP